MASEAALVVGADHLRMVFNILLVEAAIPDGATVSVADLTVPKLQAFLATQDIERSDHWVEFALRSIPLGVV